MTKRIGNQVPTQSVILPYSKSTGKEAIALYEKSGRIAQEWQKIQMEHILAINGDNLWVHTKYGYAVPRRNGKNEIVAIRELKALEDGEQALHTAHRTTTSHTAWERLKQIIEASGYTEDEDYETLRATGRERINFLQTGGRVEFRTRTSTGGLGEGFDLLVIDEAQEYTIDQESALKYVVSDSDNPQTIFCGTPPTPISGGTVFTDLRKTTLEGGTRNGGWSEWSVEEMSNPRDVDLWYATNPSLNTGIANRGPILTERKIRDEIGQDKVDFNIQRLGHWIKYNQKSAISENEWEDLKVKRLPKLVGSLFVGIKYGNDGTNIGVSIAVKTSTGKIFIESIDCRSIRQGNKWIIDFLKNADIKEVVIDGASGQEILKAEMKEARLIKPILPTVKEIIVANAAWEQGIYQQTIQHKDQPSLTQVVVNCDKRNIGSNGGFGYRSQFDDMDIVLMDSALLAFWACSESKPAKKQKVRY